MLGVVGVAPVVVPAGVAAEAFEEVDFAGGGPGAVDADGPDRGPVGDCAGGGGGDPDAGFEEAVGVGPFVQRGEDAGGVGFCLVVAGLLWAIRLRSTSPLLSVVWAGSKHSSSLLLKPAARAPSAKRELDHSALFSDGPENSSSKTTRQAPPTPNGPAEGGSGPVEPVEPVGTTGPTGPTVLAVPVGPVDPVEPVAPVSPVPPVTPVAPV